MSSLTSLNPNVASLTGSHPAVRFHNVPLVKGPLYDFEEKRARILDSVVSRTMGELSSAAGGQPDLILGEALFSERLRLKRDRPNIFNKARAKNDKALFGRLQGGLLKSAAEADRKALLESVVRHYAEEIGGHFDPAVYRFATHAVPYGFSWLLNAASVSRWLPWGLTQSLETRLRIVGEVPMLQKLADKGTILLVPTHQSNIDSVLIGYIIYLMQLPPFAYGAGLNLFSNPVLSFFMSRLGSYTVDRKKTSLIYKQTLKNYSTEILKEGVHSIFFPGGGRTRSGAIESKLKLGLLGTALEAQLENLQAGHPKPRVFIVPMVMSYHFVLEASSLVEDYLQEAGKHRFIINDDESWQPTKIARFFWRLFSTNSGVTVRIGRALDVFGNFVDEEGNSLGPNGTRIDPVRWLTSRGQLRADPQRDREYTRELGERLSDRFHRENTVLTSHLVAFAFFETLRSKYPELDLYRFLRLSRAQRTMPYDDFVASLKAHHAKVVAASERGELHLSPELVLLPTEAWLKDGLTQLGVYHDTPVVKVGDGAIWTEDLPLLYYYRNRLSGYGLSMLARVGSQQTGAHDPKGFLA